MKRYARFLLCVFALGLALVASGCFSSAAPPAPIAEVPALVNFPETVGIDVSQASGSSAGAALRTAALVKFGTSPDFSDVISLGPITFTGFNFLLDTFLKPLVDLEIPVSPTQRNFTGPMTFSPELVVLAKIDFSDFDADGDGLPEGCTGCTCPTGCAPQLTECPREAPASDLKPVCYRIWIRDVGRTEFTRFSAGRIDRYATRDDPSTPIDEENAGNGSFRMGVQTNDFGKTELVNFGVHYLHRDDAAPLSEVTEFFVRDQKSGVETSLNSLDQVHALVTQAAPQPGLPKPTLEKTVKLDMRTDPDPEDGPAIVQYIGDFLDDFDFWSGSFDLENADGSGRISDQHLCALISTGQETDRQNCIDLGIDVDDEPFIRPATDADSAFPPDFPPQPTF